MPNTQNLEGRLVGFTIDGAYYNCQTDVKLTLGTSLTKNPVCKPNPNGTVSVSWETSNVDSKNWSATGSAQSFLDSITGTKNNNDLIQKFIQGNLQVDVQILTSAALTDNENYTHDFIFDGSAILSGITLNGPSTGASTYDVTFTGNGAPTFTLIPSTT